MYKIKINKNISVEIFQRERKNKINKKSYYIRDYLLYYLLLLVCYNKKKRIPDKNFIYRLSNRIKIKYIIGKLMAELQRLVEA